jgi:uncharacterized protein YbaP (TraB family)
MLLHRFTSFALAWTMFSGTSAMAAASEASCPPQPEPPGRALLLQAHQDATDRGFLWRISRDGRDSFLYGTMHAGRPEWLALGPRTEASLSRAGALALEINVADPATRTALHRVTTMAPRVLPDELMQALRSAWVAECLPLADLEQGAAEFHVLQLAAAQARRQGLHARYGTESVLLLRSLRTERLVLGLETAQAQLSALLARNDAEAADMVRDALAELKRPLSVQALDRLSRAWAGSDLNQLETYADWCDCLNTPSEREAHARVVDSRNPGMADAVERLHRRLSVFAAVGALHLVGPQGLPALLQARGFAVTRVF